MHQPRKRFGQHFLTDQHVIAQIVAAIRPHANDAMVEIGPGEGALTFPLLQYLNALHVVEFDRDLVPVLQNKGNHKLTIHECDALKFDFQTLCPSGKKLRVVGNLPYNISTPLIFHLLSFANSIYDMTFMLQKEVALRLAASPQTADYGRLSVMTQYFCQPELLFDVGPDAFNPPPKVDSSIIRLTPYAQLPYFANDFAHFEQIVKLAFGQRRKTLRNSLKQIVSDAVWQAAGIDASRRAETLHVQEFVALSNCASQAVV